MTDHAVFEIEIKENGEVAFNKLASGADKFHTSAGHAKQSAFELDRTFDRLKETMLAAAGIFEGINFAKEGDQMYLGVKRADAEIQASLQSTHSAAGVTNDQLKESADTLYHHSEFTLENVKRMQSVLLTFPKVASGQFDEASQAILDTAAKLGGKDADLQGMALRIGKALQDPATGMMMLRREGVNFTKAQQKMVEGMVATGHQAEAQKYILKELETEFGGSAQAALSAGGAHEQMAKTVEELKLQVGEFVDKIETDLVPILSVVVEDIKKGVEWGEKHKDVLEAAAKAVGVLVIAYTAYTAATKIAAAADFLLGTSMAELTLATEAETVAAGEATEAMTALDAAMDANPIGIVIGAIAGLAAVLALAGDHADTLHYKLNHLGETKHGEKDIMSQFSSMDPEEKKSALEQVQQQIDKDNSSLQYAMDQAKHWGDASGSYANQEDDLYKEMTRLYGVKNSMLDVLNPKQKSGTGTVSTAVTTPAPDSVKANEKQITNTWNIKEFGKTQIYPTNMTEGASDVHDKLLESLTTAVNDSEIASGQ